MKFASIVSVVVLLTAVLPPCSGEAADYPTPRMGDWIVRDFRFHTGDVLPELRLHYTTVGDPTGEPVLLLHGTAGSASSFLTPSFAGQLFGPGQPLDARRHFIILPDAVGHGQSSRPSDGLRARFPRYNYDDMVAAQYRLLTEHLGVRHVRLVLGSSMGGMLTWIWGEMYPTFMDALVPLASEPTAMAGRNWMMRRMVIDAIRHDPGWNNGNYTTQPAALKTAQVFFSVATSGGARALYRATPTREETDAELDRRFELPQGSDANDVLFQFEAARDYDPAPRLDAITARLLAINSADDERNPPELGVMEHAMTRLRHGRYVLLPITDESRGHGTTGNAALWKTYLAELLVSPPGPAR